MSIRKGIRPSTTQSTVALQLKSVLNALLFFLLFMVLLPWGAAWVLPAAVGLPPWLGWPVGAALVAGGLTLWIRCLDVFSRRGAGTPFPLDAPRHLVTSGPYAVVRNPIMAGELAVIWGEAFLFGVLGLWVYAALITLLAHVLVSRIEEPELRERFGAEYGEYCRRVPRWAPWGRA